MTTLDTVLSIIHTPCYITALRLSSEKFQTHSQHWTTDKRKTDHRWSSRLDADEGKNSRPLKTIQNQSELKRRPRPTYPRIEPWVCCMDNYDLSDKDRLCKIFIGLDLSLSLYHSTFYQWSRHDHCYFPQLDCDDFYQFVRIFSLHVFAWSEHGQNGRLLNFSRLSGNYLGFGN